MRKPGQRDEVVAEAAHPPCSKQSRASEYTHVPVHTLVPVHTHVPVRTLVADAAHSCDIPECKLLFISVFVPALTWNSL